jgi:gas vesicle protein
MKINSFYFVGEYKISCSRNSLAKKAAYFFTFGNKILQIIMSFGDILYPGNPKRRQEVISKVQEMYDAMHGNFRATNKLIDYLNRNIKGTNLTHVSVHEHSTFKENAQVLQERVADIQTVIKKIDADIGKDLDPVLYKKLKDEDTSFEDKFLIAEKVTTVVSAVASVTTMVVVTKLATIDFGEILFRSLLNFLAESAVGAIAGALVGAAIDLIVGAISGAVERHKLDKTISELDEALKEFVPASEDYTDSIYEVLAEVKIFNRKR